jgi:acetoacetyl-CoA synthetase
MSVEVWNDSAESVIDQKGELVCTKTFVSKPIGFWNDKDKIKYSAAYFQKFPNVWCNGDYVSINDAGGMQFYGRSDTILNPGGVRIGTAEIYRQVELLDEIVESIVVGQQWQNDVRVVLFVKLASGLLLNDELRTKICSQVRLNTTPRHVPAKIIQVSDIPRTKSGKIVELAVQKAIHGMPIENHTALANPESLKQYYSITSLQS